MTRDLPATFKLNFQDSRLYFFIHKIHYNYLHLIKILIFLLLSMIVISNFRDWV